MTAKRISPSSGCPRPSYSNDMENCLNSSSSPSKSQSERFQNQRTLLVHINKETVKLTLFSEREDPIPITDVFDECIPFIVGVVKQKTFVFGQRCQMCKDRSKSNPSWKKHLVYWDLGKTLVNGAGSATPIKFNSRYIDITAELLTGMFFKYIASLTENFCGDATSTTRIMFALPNWFSSWARQTLKNAAEVAGFKESFVVNETTLLSYIHLGNLRRSHNPSIPETRTIITIVENFGRVSIAFYTGSWNSFLHASAFTSTEINSARFDRTYRKMQYWENLNDGSGVESVPKYRQAMFKALWAEFLEKLPVKSVPKSTDILCFCDDPEWKKLIQTEVNCLVYNHFGIPPHAKKEKQQTYPDPPMDPFQLVSIQLRDILPLPVFRESSALGVRELKIMEGEQEIESELSFNSDIHSHDCSSKFYQCSINSKHLQFGVLNIRQWLIFKYLNFKVNIVVSKEGIYKVNGVTGVMKAKEEPLNCPDDYCYSSNVLRTEIPKVSKEVETLYSESVQTRNTLSKLKEELWTVCAHIQDMHSEGKYKVVPERKMRHEIIDQMKLIHRYLVQPVDVSYLDETYLQSSLTKANDYLARYFDPKSNSLGELLV